MHVTHKLDTSCRRRRSPSLTFAWAGSPPGHQPLATSHQPGASLALTPLTRPLWHGACRHHTLKIWACLPALYIIFIKYVCPAEADLEVQMLYVSQLVYPFQNIGVRLRRTYVLQHISCSMLQITKTQTNIVVITSSRHQLIMY